MDTHIVEPSAEERRANSVADLKGEQYTKVLRRFHQELRPKSYLEVGSLFGDSLAFVECPAISVDPDLSKLRAGFIGKKTICTLFQMPSDRFFEEHRDPKSHSWSGYRDGFPRRNAPL